MGLLTPTKRVYHRWRSVLPLYDGRACPDCGAVICGREDRRRHRELHMAREQYEERIENIIRQIARYAGMTVIEDEPRDQSDGYGRVDLRAPDSDEDEEDDDAD